MIQIGETTIDFSDPLTLAALIASLVALLVVVILLITLRRAGRASDAVEMVATQLGRMSQDVQSLGQGQQQLAGNIQIVSDAQANAQVQTVQTMEARLAEVQAHMAERLSDNALK